MAEFLIMNRTNGSGEGHYRKGDIVIVREDGHPWGTQELDTNVFLVVKVPGVPAEKLEYLHTDGAIMRRKWQFLVDSLDAETKETIVSKGEAVIGMDVDKTTAENVLINKETLEKGSLDEEPTKGEEVVLTKFASLPSETKKPALMQFASADSKSILRRFETAAARWMGWA